METKVSNQFKNLYSGLNLEQKECVDSIEGPVMVVAGPGTGKTHILTLRVAKILLETDSDPENILALTFTEGAAFEMRARLAGIIGSSAYRAGIHTFHGFCNNVIQEFPEHFTEILGSEPISEADQIKMLQGIIENGEFKHLRPFGNQYYYVRPLLSQLSELKREGVDPDSLEKAVQLQQEELEEVTDMAAGKLKDMEKKVSKNWDLLSVYRMYQEGLRSQGSYDYDDMILEVLKVFKENEDLLSTFQERYLYILADEHQDANRAQNQVLELLISGQESPNIFIVGDEKQAIFRFQGASLENFAYFQNKYPKAKRIRLHQNYRSTQSILDASSSMIGEEEGSLRSQSKDFGSKVAVCPMSDPESELYFVARSVQGHIDNGVPERDIAVLYRDNRDSVSLVRVFQKLGIPYVIETDRDVLDDYDIQNLLSLFRAIDDFGNDELLGRVIQSDFIQVPPMVAYKVFAKAQKARCTLYEVLERVDEMDEINEQEKEILRSIYKKLNDWKVKSGNSDLLSLFEEVVRDSGFLMSILRKPEAFEKTEKLRRLFAEARSLVLRHSRSSIKDLLSVIDVLQENNLSLKKKVDRAEFNGVRLMTAHKAKGREFSVVHIIHGHDGRWGNRRRRNLFLLPASLMASGDSSDDEERKLFYVALTRAKKKVYISYSKEGENGKPQLPTRFLEELRDDLKETLDNSSLEGELKDNPSILFAAPQAKDSTKEEKELVKRMFLEKGFSATSLNSYLSCPWRYFYSNLLRIPRASSKQQRYGTAVHAALKSFFDAHASAQGSKELLISKFEEHLDKEAGGLPEYEEMKEKGVVSLSGYYDQNYEDWVKEVSTEVSMRAKLPGLEPELIGNVDKVEFLNDRDVRIVDYKTGKPRSRNDIEGKTASSNGDYKRQLVFYRLLSDLFWEGKYNIASLVLDFVEPNDRGKFNSEEFTVTDAEVEELKSEILRVADEIMNLKFWNATCDNKDCEFCALRAGTFS